MVREIVLKTPGALSSAAWLQERGLDATRTANWYVEITLLAAGGRIELNIYPEEWGYIVRVAGKVSSIRATDVAFVHGRDEHQLLAHTPELNAFGTLLRRVEDHHATQFSRTSAVVHSNLVRASGIVRSWLATL